MNTLLKGFKKLFVKSGSFQLPSLLTLSHILNNMRNSDFANNLSLSNNQANSSWCVGARLNSMHWGNNFIFPITVFRFTRLSLPFKALNDTVANFLGFWPL